MKKDEVYVVLLFGGLALALIILDRVFRIQPFLERQGFQSGGGRSLKQMQRCGIYGGAADATCPHPLRCINGLCMPEEVSRIVDKNPLPVLP